MLGLGAVLWIVQILNAANDYSFNRFALRPRTLDGLVGIVVSPFLHSSYGQLLANTGPFVLIGWAVLLSGLRVFAIVSGLVIGLGGLATWLIAPSSSVILGTSALILGWLGYLIARAFFARKFVWIGAAVLACFFFGTLLVGLLPSLDEGAWQGHLFGFAAGVFAAWLLHPRRPRRRSA